MYSRFFEIEVIRDRWAVAIGVGLGIVTNCLVGSWLSVSAPELLASFGTSVGVAFFVAPGALAISHKLLNTEFK